MTIRARFLGSILALASIVSYTMLTASCADDETGSGGTGPCPNGICGSGADAQGGAGSGAGGPGSGPGGGGGSVVTCAWVCSPWDTAGNGDDATRTCIDVDGCADPNAKPPESVTLPALDENAYRCNVEPVLDRLCSQLGCHGVEPTANDPGRALRVYHRGRLRAAGGMLTSLCPSGGTVPSEDCIGSIECACFTDPHLPIEWQRNFDAARGFALDAQTGQPLADLTQSEMLTQPDKTGGLPHAGIKIWDSGDADYQTLLSWLEGQTLGSCNTTN